MRLQNLSLVKDSVRLIVVCQNWRRVLVTYIKNHVFSYKEDYLFIMRRPYHTLVAPAHPGSFYDVYLKDCYQFDLLPWPDGSKNPQLIIDIGANIGAFTVRAALRYPNAKVLAVEPSPHACRYLKTNISMNMLDERVTVVQAAVAESSGISVLHESEESIASSLYFIPQSHFSDIAVTSISIEELLDSIYLPIDIVKVDCEGCEYDLVRLHQAQIWQRVKYILLELHIANSNLALELIKTLQILGFEMAWQSAEISNTKFKMITLALYNRLFV